MGTVQHRAAGADRSPRPGLLLSRLLLSGLLSASVFAPLAALAATGVRVQVDGRILPLSESVDTVREALRSAGVTLDADDEVTPALDAPATDGGVIRVSRVSYSETEAEVAVPYRTIVRAPGPGRRPYHPTVIREGRAGLRRTRVRVKTVDGREAERTTLSAEVLREPVEEIVVARAPAKLSSRGAYAGQRTLAMVATAYDPGGGSCGKYADGKTCNGKRAGYGIVAVDPKLIPLGTKLFVPGYGYGIASDVGGAIKGNRIDLGFNSRAGAMKWGKKKVSVRIVD